MIEIVNDVLWVVIRGVIVALAMAYATILVYHIHCHICAANGSVKHIRLLNSSGESDSYDLPPEHRKLKDAIDHLDDCFDKYGSKHELTTEAKKNLSLTIEEFHKEASSES